MPSDARFEFAPNQMEVQTPCVRVASAAELGKQLTGLHAIPKLDPEAFRQEVGGRGEAPAAPVQDQVISSGRLQRDRRDARLDCFRCSPDPSLISATKPSASMLAMRPTAGSRFLGLKQAFFAHDTHGLLQDADALDEPGQLVG